uniref:Adenylate kinase active site lid domain-containing protein n=1 Tax=Zooxanthella nutricula TaxID=1333877 RepID=A0A7S2J4R8_9DINO
MEEAARDFRTVRAEFGGLATLSKPDLVAIFKEVDAKHFTDENTAALFDAAGLAQADTIEVDDLLGWVFGVVPQEAAKTAAAQAPAAGPIVVIAGPPAAGKGTQCEKIKERYGYVHVSTGDILRENVEKGTELGKEAKAYMDGGKLVPSSLIVNLVKDRLGQPDIVEKGCLLDGFPRAPDQAQAMAEAGLKVQRFVLIQVPDDDLVSRGVGRRLDPETGSIYHLTFKPPPPEIVDRLVHRSDDHEEKIRTRLATYHSQIGDIQPYFQDCEVVVNGTEKPDAVFANISASLDAL